MREIRTFEMGYDEPATAWRADHALVVEVEQGTLWVTFEGDAEDYWVDPGQSFLLPAGARAWIGAGRGDVRLALIGAGDRGKLDRSAPAPAGPKAAAAMATTATGLAARWRHAVA